MSPATFLRLALMCGLAACARFPEVESTVPAGLEAQPFPDLLPYEATHSTRPAEADEDTAAKKAAALAASAARLRARAAALRSAG